MNAVSGRINEILSGPHQKKYLFDRPDFSSYQKIIIPFHGGLDDVFSLCSVLALNDDLQKVELHYHDFDAQGDPLIDWPSSRYYAEDIARHFHLPLVISSWSGGFLNWLAHPESSRFRVDTEYGPIEVDWHPQSEACQRLEAAESYQDIWATLKSQANPIVVTLCCDPNMRGKKILVVATTQNSLPFDHRLYQHSPGFPQVDFWHPGDEQSEEWRWEVLRQFGVVPHIAHQLGWKRFSPRCWPFNGPNQWATVRELFPACFEVIAGQEQMMPLPFIRATTIRRLAEQGKTSPLALDKIDLIKEAVDSGWRLPVTASSKNWKFLPVFE